MTPGTLFESRFTIEGVAGTGGMGTVFRALDRTTGEPVALKLLTQQEILQGVYGSQPLSDARSQRFLREANVLAELRHPGIVSYVAHGVSAGGVPYLAMEWLRGEDLAERLNHGGLTLHESVTLIKHVAEALAVAHRRGIVHRDLKPSNLFLRDGRVEQVVILDFGIARRMMGGLSQALTKTGVLVGTPDYMAPEQARGAREIPLAADIFSLGCVLFECLTRRSPFVAEHVAALLAKILFDDAPLLRTVRPELPEPLEKLVARMLLKDPAARIKDADALLEAIEALGELPDIAEPGAVSQPPRPSRVSGEQRLVGVIIASDQVLTAASAELPTLDASDADARRKSVEAFRVGIASFGARLEPLANGSIVVTIPQTGGAATDLATQAARCALYIKERWPEARVVLATGRGAADTRVPMGEALDKAARMLNPAAGAARISGGDTDTVWIDDVTAGLLGPSFRERRFVTGMHALHGEQLDADESRLLLGKPTPCVGREHELTLLEGALNHVDDESVARAVLVIAEPGMGKSRLRHEFLRRLAARAADVEVMIGRGDPMSAGSSFGLLSRALQRLFGVSDGDPPDVRRARLAARVALHVPEADAPRVSAFLGEICNASFPSEHGAQLRAARNDPKLMSDHIGRALIDFFRAECAHRTVLLVLEDLHWGDALTVKHVDALLRELADAPLFVLSLARPEVKEQFPVLWQGRVQEVPLARLSRKACERLIREVLGRGLSPDEIQRLVAMAAGNALFLEELIRAAAEGKGGELPETVLAMLQARLSRLDAVFRHILRAASVFGETFWRGGVLALLAEEGEGSSVGRWLQELVEHEIIQAHPDSRFPSDPEYGFRHALVRDAAYSLLTDEDRKLGHRLAGKYLEAIGERDPLLLAEHFQRGGERASALPYFARAAMQALDGSDLDAAIERAERAVTCGAQGKDLGTVRAIQAWALFWRADLAQAFPVALEALSLLPAGSYHWCRAIGNAFIAAGLIGKFAELGEWIAKFSTVEPDSEARTPFVEAISILAGVFSLTGQRQKANQVILRMDEVGARIEAGDPTARGWIRHAHNWHIRFLEPEPWRAYRSALEAIQAFEEAGDRRMAAVETVYLGIAQWDLGHLAEAEATLRGAMAEGTELNEVLVLRLTRIYLALLLIERGDPAALDEVHELATVVTRGSPGTYYAGLAHCAIAQELCARGDLEAALAEARLAVQTLCVAPPLQPFGHTVLAEVLLAADRAAEACDAIAQGVAQVDAIGGAGRQEPKLRVLAVEARRAMGDDAGAREALAVARRLLDARADTVPELEARRRFFTEVPDNARLVTLCKIYQSAA